MNRVIEIKDLNYKFKDKQVFKNLNIEFEENKIYGLLGKNGAGKTTLINIMTNQLMSKNGDIKVLGLDPRINPEVLENICVVREREFYNNEAKVKTIFNMYSSFYSNYDKELEKKLCEVFDINQKARYKKLSRGMKTSVSNIVGICSNAKITIFDEPTIGLDALNRKEFYDILLESYVNKKRSIIISTHLIEEIGELLEKVAIIKDGSVLVNDYVENINTKSYYISGNKEDLKRLKILKGVKEVRSFGNIATYSYYGDIGEGDMKIINECNIELDNMNLQDLFININKKGVKVYE
ncbi:MAG: ATP-binding cassette domain-containing protein [Paraclostridium sp.]|uniref:ABC transporter ATP-binding protein n=1 Tax=Paeniclostridium hominis TaxID=2764329 RepID=A0ABR7K2Y4_9FIRM|nr:MULTISPECIES: ABC transporter ATP-binding protein [Paeniclostridium]MBC6003214.1 ABC transporter ATP-binding protein [Paeniclostridium hominis]